MRDKVDLQAILFDLDGTLISSAELSRRTLDILVEKYRKDEFPDEIRRSFRGMPTRQILEHIDPDRIDNLLQEVVELQNEFRQLSHLYPGIFETLEALGTSGIQLGVITAQAAPEMKALRDHFPLDEFIKVWISADDVLHPKPDPESIHKTLEILDVAKEKTLFVGDSHYDIIAGKRSGVLSGAALWGRNDAHDLLAFDPDFLFNDPVEIQELCLP